MVDILILFFFLFVVYSWVIFVFVWQFDGRF